MKAQTDKVPTCSRFVPAMMFSVLGQESMKVLMASRPLRVRLQRSVPLTLLKRFLCSGDEKDLPPIDTPEYLMARLPAYHEHQYEQSGNYALN